MTDYRKPMVNVILRDGNRTVNWDYPEDTPLLDVLKNWKFSWETDSVRVCGMPIPDSLLYRQIEEFVFSATKCCRFTGSLFVDMVQPKKKKKEVVTNDG